MGSGGSGNTDAQVAEAKQQMDYATLQMKLYAQQQEYESGQSDAAAQRDKKQAQQSQLDSTRGAAAVALAGRRSTIMTSPLGVVAPAPVANKTILGG